jgi:hypothetical protein
MAEEYSRKLSDQQDILAEKFKEANKKTNPLNMVIAVLFGIIIGLSIHLVI